MNLRQLESFVDVVESGSFTAASARLIISQPALSRQIADLERELGTRLLVRTASGVRVTPAGASLQRHAQRVLALVRETQAVVDEAPASLGSVRLGVAPGLSTTWLQRTIAGARSRLPGVEIVVSEESTEQQAIRITRGELDAGFVHRAPVGVTSSIVCEQPLGLAYSGSGPTPESPTIGFRELDGLVVVSHAPQETGLHHDQLLFTASRLGVEPRWVFRQFSQHPDLAVELAGAAGVVLTEPSAARLPSGWSWRALSDPGVPVITYLVRPVDQAGIARDVVDALLRAVE